MRDFAARSSHCYHVSSFKFAWTRTPDLGTIRATYRPTQAKLIRNQITTRKWCIVSSTRATNCSSFSQPLASGIALGVIVTGGLYALILTSSLNNPLLRRFCFSHWTAGVSMALFFMAIVLLANKLRTAHTQLRLTSVTVNALGRLIQDGHGILPAERPRWLEAS